MFAAIPYNSGTHVKYFATGRAVYDKYYGVLIRISAQHVNAFNLITMDKMIKWLRVNDSEECATSPIIGLLLSIPVEVL